MLILCNLFEQSMRANMNETWDKWFQWKIKQVEKLLHVQGLDLNSQYTPSIFHGFINTQIYYLRFGSAVKWQKTQNSTNDQDKRGKKFLFRYKVSGAGMVV